MFIPGRLTSPSEVRRLLREYGLRPKKRLGQSFLVDGNILDKIIAAAEIEASDCVLEIGPGLGTLTTAAAERAEGVVCVEADRDLIPILRRTTSGSANVEIVHSDFLSLDLSAFLHERFAGRKCVVLGNLPYYITSPIVSTIIESRQSVARAVLMVQKEVADRLAASPGSGEYGSFGVYVNYYCVLEVIGRAPRSVFLPPPGVDSAIIRLTPRESPPVRTKDEATFFAVVRAAFQQRRKTLANALAGAKGLGLDKEKASRALTAAGVEPSRRGETLTMEEFAAVADALQPNRYF